MKKFKKLIPFVMILSILFMMGCAPYLPDVADISHVPDVPEAPEATPEPTAKPTATPKPEATSTPVPTEVPEKTPEETAHMEQDYTAMADKIIEEFKNITEIPRPSHNEKLMGEYLVAWAAEHGFTHEQDAHGNVIVDKPATAGNEQAPLVVLQAHQDIVTVQKEGYDPLTDGVTVIDDGITLTADGTTLGADNGIGIAIIMTLFESNENFGALRAIFTTDEEDGMDGASSLDAKYLEDAQYFINVDSEQSNAAFISSAGSLDYSFSMDPESAEATKTTPLAINISGLLGGHSGIDINLGRASAIKLAAQVLDYLMQNDIPFELASINGGSARNAIPTDCTVVIVADASAEERIETLLAQVQESALSIYGDSDPGLNISVSNADMPETVFTQEQLQMLVSTIELQKTGVIAMSQTVPGLVETSCNMGTISATPEGVSIAVMTRSSKDAMQDSMLVTATALAKLTDMQIRDISSYPGWPANASNELAALMSTVYSEQNGEDFQLMAIHAGLECGYFAQKNPDMNVISVGPDISNPHTANETLNIASVSTTCALLVETLNRLAK